MRRREFITLLGGAAAWPLGARAQQPGMPVVAYLSSRSAESDASMLVPLRRGLNETGYIEGRNVEIEYRFGDGQVDRLSAMLSELARRQVGVIIFAGASAAYSDALLQQLRASPIPIVFNSGADPIGTGLVANFDRPGGNLTGVFTLVRALTAKNFGLLHELVPKATAFGLLSGHVLGDRQAQTDAVEAAARLRLQTRMLAADTDGELDEAFATLDRARIGGLVVVTSPFFVTRARQIAALAARHRMPAIYGRREYAEAGGLMSYGYDVAASYRQMGNYAGRILKGEKPGDLPVVQPTKYEFVINLRTAKALGIEVPSTLLAIADEVIE